MRRLTEWVDKNGNKITLKSTAASNTQTNIIKPGYFKSKFEKLSNHLVDIYGFCDIRYLSDDVLKLYHSVGFDEYLLEIVTDYGKYPMELLYERVQPTKGQITRATFSSYEQLLDKLLHIGVIKDKKLCESKKISTIDDFQLYENLWD